MLRPGDIPWKVAHGSYRHARRVVVFVVGISVVVVGLIMFIPLVPGPGFLVIPIGLAILAIEFEWARRALRRVKDMAANMQQTIANGIGGAKSQQPSVPADQIGNE